MRLGSFLIVLALLPAASPCRAQLQSQVTPVKYNLATRPGAPLSRDVLVTNQGDAPVVVRVRFSDWALSEQGDLSLQPPGSTPHSLAGRVTFEPREFSLQTGESGHVRVMLSMPADGPSTLWGVLLSEVRPADFNGVHLGPRAIVELGTTLYLTREPASPVRADVVGMNVFPLGDDSLSVSVRIRNAGDRHFYVAGEIAIADSGGARVGGGRIGNGVVLPGGFRNFTWTCDGLKPGRYQLTATLDTGEPELMVGETWFQWPVPAPAPPQLAQQYQR